MEKTLRLVSKIMIVLAVICIIVLVFLRVAFPPAKIKTMIENYAKTELNREIKFDEISFRIIGVDLYNFALSEENGFNSGTFITTKRLSFKVKLLPLLKKDIYVYHVEASELFVDFIKKDGKYNVFGAGAERAPLPAIAENREGRKINFLVSDVEIKNSQLQCFDKDANRTYIISDLFCSVSDLQFQRKFETRLKFKFQYKAKDKEISLPFDGQLTADLKNMNLFAAWAELKTSKIRYNGTVFSVNAKAVNFLNPHITLAAETDVFSDATLKDFVPSGAVYKFDRLKAYSEFSIDFKNKVLSFDTITVNSGNSKIKSSGSVYYEKNNERFEFDQVLSLDIGQVLNSFEKHPEKTGYSGTFNAKAAINKDKISVDAWSNDLTVIFKEAGITLPLVSGKSAFEINFSSKELIFSNLDFFVFNSTITSSGIYGLDKYHAYDFSARMQAEIQNVAPLFEKYAKDLSPEGFVDVSVKFTNAGIKGHAALKSAKMKYMSFVDLGGLNGHVFFDTLDNIRVSSMTGVLNGEKFVLSASYLKDLRDISVAVNMRAEKLHFPEMPDNINRPNNATAQSSGTAVAVPDTDIPYTLNLKLNVHADSVEFQNLRSKKLDIRADLKGITNGYDSIKGNFSFDSEKVVIKNLEKLIKKNVYSKTLFFILGITYETTEEMGVKVFEEDSSLPDKSDVGLKFSSAAGKAEFVPGYMNIKRLKLSSALSSITLAGGVGLQTKVLNMRLMVSPLLGKAFVIRIGGTLEHPESSVDLIGSALAVLDKLQDAGVSIYDAAKKHKKEE